MRPYYHLPLPRPARQTEISSQTPVMVAPAKPRNPNSGRPNMVRPPGTVMAMDDPTMSAACGAIHLVAGTTQPRHVDVDLQRAAARHVEQAPQIVREP
ncbi:MAG: hypothetical protein JSW10_05250 [Pseudomonadota bacterium]|nr:MAG: hypothetical protein JSW10_05250 [Pseudomonadota bacterium]